MMISRKAKEALKVGLALALVYGIALQVNWMNPYWAGWAVGMCALSTSGESIYKGMMRVLGTIPAIIAALAILSLAPQERWLFMALICSWMFITAYLMLAYNNSYFWMVAGFTCLVITLTGPSSSEALFEHAMYRGIETALGVITYSFIVIFLWPVTNTGAVKQAASSLTANQIQVFKRVSEVISSRSYKPEDKQQLKMLLGQESALQGQLKRALVAEGTETYEIRSQRHHWLEFQRASIAIMDSLNRWQTELSQQTLIDMMTTMPNLAQVISELEHRFEQIDSLFAGEKKQYYCGTIDLSTDSKPIALASIFERASIALIKHEIELLDTLTQAQLKCVEHLTAERSPGLAPTEPAFNTKTRNFSFPVLDLDHLIAACFVVACTASGFLIWIFFDPPGHASWYQLSGSVGLGIAGMPLLRVTRCIKPLAIASALSLAAYVFIMPQLSTFVGLGLLLFSMMFINRYFFDGIPQLMGTIAIINMIAVSNPQTYNFAAMANSYVFTLAAFLLVFAMTYIMRSPRPEKAVLHQLSRFFHSAHFLTVHAVIEPRQERSPVHEWKTRFHRHEVQKLPTQLGAWSKAINPAHFPDNSPEQVNALVLSLQDISYRLDALGHSAPLHLSARQTQIHTDIEHWRSSIATLFHQLIKEPKVQVPQTLRDNLNQIVSRLEVSIQNALEKLDTHSISSNDAESFYHLLGCLRGVSEALTTYAEAASSINWTQWREERFA